MPSPERRFEDEVDGGAWALGESLGPEPLDGDLGAMLLGAILMAPFVAPRPDLDASSGLSPLPRPGSEPVGSEEDGDGPGHPPRIDFGAKLLSPDGSDAPLLSVAVTWESGTMNSGELGVPDPPRCSQFPDSVLLLLLRGKAPRSNTEL